MVEGAAHPVQVQGLCRFSYPCTGGFKKYHDSLSERRAALYQPRRLDQRLAWFTEIGLPGIAAQCDPDFSLHILLGEDLPAPWRDPLEAAIRAVPQIVPHFLPPMDHRVACVQVLQGGRDPARPFVAEFRLDDDDAVAVNYVERLRQMHGKVQPLALAKGRVALDHGRGLIVEATAEGAIRLHQVHTHCWSAGLAVYLRVRDEATIMHFPHHKIWMRLPFVNLTNEVMFIRGDHLTNDARTPWAAAGRIETSEAEFSALLQDRFRVDIDRFRHRWAQVSGG
jgi:hypothetical protein